MGMNGECLIRVCFNKPNMDFLYSEFLIYIGYNTSISRRKYLCLAAFLLGKQLKAWQVKLLEPFK